MQYQYFNENANKEKTLVIILSNEQTQLRNVVQVEKLI